MTKAETIGHLRRVLLQKESSGDYTAYNADGQAFGGYQFQQPTWDAAAEEAGYSDYIGVDIRSVPPAIQDAIFTSYMDPIFDTFNGDIRYMANAHYAGIGAAVEHYNAGTLPDGDEGGYDSQATYADRVVEMMKEEGFNPFDSFNPDQMTAFTYNKSAIEQQGYENTQPDGFWAESTDKFMGQVDDWAVTGAIKPLYANIFHAGNPFNAPAKVTEDDVKYVTTALVGDEDAQRFVLLNGRDTESIRYLTQMKLEERARKERLANYSWGLSSMATAAGALLDPLNLVPIGNGLKIVKALKALKTIERTGGAITNVAKLNKYATMTIQTFPKIAPYTAVGIQAAAFNTSDTALRGLTHGEEVKPRDYTWSAAAGFLFGAVGGALGDKVMNFKSTQTDSMRLASSIHTAEDNAIRYAADLPLTNGIRNETREMAANYHDKKFIETFGNEHLKGLEGNQEVFAMSLKDAKELGKSFGKPIGDKVKGLHVPNEDYTILIKDNIKNPAKDLLDILQHERIGHSGMRNVMGEKAYDKLMNQIKKDVDVKDSTWQKARDLAHSYDPEEIFAYALENGMLKRNIMQSVLGNVRSSLKKQGIDRKLSEADISKYINKAMQSDLERKTGVYYNDDGSTVWAGVRFSEDNLMNPRLWENYFDLEQDVLTQAQGTLAGKHLVGTKAGKLLMKVGASMENSKYAGVANPYGVAVNSLSKTMKKYGGMLMTDSRMGNRLGHAHLPAERQKAAIQGQLMGIYNNYIDLRSKYMTHTITDPWGRKSAMEFDRMVQLAYNKKYANHTNCPDSLPQEVEQAVDVMKKYFDEQLAIGKKSADMFGIKTNKNLIETDWVALDHEFRRVSDPDLINRFLHMFPSIEKAQQYLKDYYRAFAKRDVIAAKIKRKIEKENKKLPEGAEPKPSEVTDKMIDDYLDEHVPNAVAQMLGADMHQMNKTGQVGELSFYKERIPLDTSGVMQLPSGNDFSFDNNLRNYNMDYIISRNANRFAGESAISNTFKDTAHLKQVKEQVWNELNKAASDGKLDRSRAEFEHKQFEEVIDELRGMRPQRDSIGKLGAIARIFQNLSYAKNAAQMMFAQMAEVGGLMAYTGARGIFSMFSPLRKLAEDAKYGRVSAQELRDMSYQIWGETQERYIWPTNFEDRVVREGLTESTLLNKGLIFASDQSKNLGKITSQINVMGHMTDSMTRYARSAVLGDMVRWAHGEKFSDIRNPFSDAKLKGANISQADALQLQECLRKYVTVDKNGNPIKSDLAPFQRENPNMFWKMYELGQNQVDRALVNGRSMSNRSILKDLNSFTRLMFQFKDYAFRAVNSQGMRIMTARDADDFIAVGMSIVSNIAAYTLKAGLTVATLNAMGAPEKAKEHWDKYMSNDQLLRVAAFRSLLGSPVSPANDVYEAVTGAPSIRTTVDSKQRSKLNDPSDFSGNFIAQAPGIQTGWGMAQGLYGAYNLFNDTASKRDFRNALNIFPFPNFIPLVQGINLTVDQSKYPDKRPK